MVINATGAFCRRRAAAGRSRGGRDHRAEPGHSPRVRSVVPAGDERHHGAAHERRARDVRDPVARPHGRGHDRHAHRASRRWSRGRSSSEIEFILETAALYLHKAPTRADVLSVFAGIRPLVRRGDSRITAALSRDHTIHIDPSGLLTIAGGKWTTYRHMAEDTVDQAAEFARLPERPCVTAELRIHGFHPHAEQSRAARRVRIGRARRSASSSATEPRLAEPLDAAVPCTGAQVVWAAREEMARTVEDVLARRCRALFLNAAAAIRMAPAVGRAARARARTGRGVAAEPGCRRSRHWRGGIWFRESRIAKALRRHTEATDQHGSTRMNTDRVTLPAGPVRRHAPAGGRRDTSRRHASSSDASCPASA